MAMKLIKKTAEYKIFMRGDDRYAVQDAASKPVNGEEKVRILMSEDLIKVALPSSKEELPESDETADTSEPQSKDSAEGPAAEGETESDPSDQE